MPKISINILTKNRAELLKKALASIESQSFRDFDIVIVDDGSTDGTKEVLKNLKIENLRIITHEKSIGITASRQEALLKSAGEYIAILDDDDGWVDPDKLKKQADFLNAHPDCVIVGGGMKAELGSTNYELRFRPEGDRAIRTTMFFRNNFFTSTVMFRKDAAIKAGGFVRDESDLAEDYDLWLRMGGLGTMHNFHGVFTAYRFTSYNKEKFKQFLQKQLKLICQHKSDYPFYLIAAVLIRIRVLF